MASPARLHRRNTVLQKSFWLMGVVNATPDSFYAASRASNAENVLERVARMIQEGMDVLDLGAESTRPGSPPISADEEWRRLEPLLSALRLRFPDLAISLDTQKASVLKRALAYNVDIVNDVSALRADPEMGPVAAAGGLAVILMHMQGTPATMQTAPRYEDVVGEVEAFLTERVQAAERFGFSPDQILLDPGIGFGKTLDHNVALMRQLRRFTSMKNSVLIGVSRKSMIGRLAAAAGEESALPEARLHGSVTAAAWALSQGVRGFRVHDVAPTAEALRVWRAFQPEGAR